MISRSDIIASAEPCPNRMLAPSAYSEALLPSLRLARASRFARRVGKTLLASLMISTVFVAIAPWQQSVTGSGDVIAFAPLERQQTIDSPTKGRVVRLGDKVYENAHVKKGEVIAEVQDVDPQLMTRLGDQLASTRAQVEANRVLLKASERNRDAAMTVVSSWQNQLRTYTSVKEQIVGSADAAIAAAKNKVEAERRKLEEVEASLVQTEADYKRQKALFDEQIVAEVKYQLAERKLKEAQAKVEQSKALIDLALNDQKMKERDRNAKEQKAQVDIDYAQASLDKARQDVAKSESEVAKAGAELNKAEKLLSEMETKVARQQGQVITAPFDGFLTRINASLGQILKEGSAICVIVPDTKDRAVQVWLDGNDAPLVSPGRHVRLQFEGWPAIQFAGWPSVAVGTFGGTVVSVDATDDGKGKFRALIRPDENVQQEWPDERYLRQGVRANAWVLLEQVPLWYEVWRNMNGFPPVVEQSTGDSKNKSKPPKLPKS